MNSIAKYLIILLFAFSGALHASVQKDSITTSAVNDSVWVYLSDSTQTYITDNSVTITEFLANYSQYESNEKFVNHKSLWHAVHVTNNTINTSVLYLGSEWGFEWYDVYMLKNDVIIDTGYFGVYVPASQRSMPNYYAFYKLVLEPYEEVDLVFKGHQISDEIIDQEYFMAGNQWFFDGYISAISLPQIRKYGITIGFLGSVIIMLLFMLLLFAQNPSEKVYLYYAIYLGVTAFYFMLKISTLGPFHFSFQENYQIRKALNEPLQFLLTITYNVFAIRFLNIKVTAPKLYKSLMVVNIVYGLYAIGIFTYLMVTHNTVATYSLFGITRIIVFVISVALIIWGAVAIKGPLIKYFVLGSSVFVLGSLVAVMYSIKIFNLSLGGYFNWLPDTWMSPINISEIGVLIEILLFSLGIGKLIKINNQERERIREAYISELEKNEKLITEHSLQLESKVEERTSEVLTKTKELSEVKSNQQKLEYERRLMEQEMRLLRVQMNPHFLFNSLNSIRYFILSQNEEKAIDYIESFSKLLRMILDYSKRDFISLEEELLALDLYVKFERERFNKKFDYNLVIDPEISTGSIAIQPLLLQPFVENSIWHGLMHKDDKGCLTIKINKTAAHEMTITIEDNGIGREKAAEIAKRNGKKHTSHGMDITRSRLAVLNDTNENDFGFEIQDLKSEDGKPSGTKVVFTLKTKYYESNTY